MEESGNYWLNLARDAYDSSTSYVDNNYRKQWEDAIAMFQNRHPADSKYNQESYRHRSRLFRPKSRSIVRRNEAAAAAAFFSNLDVVNIEPVNPNSAAAAASAKLMKEVLQYRLTQTIPWFQIVVGGMQDAQVQGVVCSYQYWKFKQRVSEQPQVVYGEDGLPQVQKQQVAETIEDKPCIELVPVENLRIDPSANWVDPINSSPYVIWLMPMYVQDIKARMVAQDGKTYQQKWKTLTDGQLQAAIGGNTDTTRIQREKGREDSMQADRAVSDFDVAWVHMNIIRQDDQDFLYYTLGTEHLLTDPQPLSQVYLHGERPFVLGVSVIETHKIMPPGVVTLGEHLQREANEVVNQRLDNVKLVLNKRWIVRRGSQVDSGSLVKNVPGGVTLSNDPERDIREVNWPDVTASAYAEQDRINVDYDELTGNFSAGSVQTNRKMNETVGGMNLLAGGANMMTEYLIRTFTETWVERVLRQLVKLEQAYETDETVLAIAAGKAQLMPRYGISRATDALLNQDLVVKVNVGIGATDPNMKLSRLVMAARTIGELSQIPGMNVPELAKEIYGIVGHGDGERFLSQNAGIPPQVQQALQQAQQQIQQLTQQLQQARTQEQQAMARLQLDKAVKQAQIQMDWAEMQIKAAQEARQMQWEHEFKVAQLQIEAQMDQRRLDESEKTKRQVAVMETASQKQAEPKQVPVTVQYEMGADVGGNLGMMMSHTMAAVAEHSAQAHNQSTQAILAAMQALQGTIAEAVAEKEKPERKVMRIQAPSGAVYEGTIVEQ